MSLLEKANQRLKAKVEKAREAANPGFYQPADKHRNNLEPAAERRECRLMGNSQGRDNVKKRAARRKKTERLAREKNGDKKKTK